MAMARRMCRRWAGRSSSLSVSRPARAAQPSPGRSSTLSSMECDTAKLDVSGSGGGRDQPVEGVLPPGHEALGRLGAHHLATLLDVVARLGQGLLVVDDVLRGLGHDPAGVVEAGPAGPAGDLVELPGRQQPADGAVVLGQLGEDARCGWGR